MKIDKFPVWKQNIKKTINYTLSIAFFSFLVSNTKEIYNILKTENLKTFNEIPEYTGKLQGAQLLTNHTAFQTIISCIDNAEHTIEITMYEWHNDDVGKEILDYLVAVSKKGVKVILYKDNLGSSFIGEGKNKFVGEQIIEDENMAGNMNIVLKNGLEFGPRGSRIYSDFNNHAKYWSFDVGTSKEKIIMGSMNVGNQYKTWNDCMLLLQGKNIGKLAQNHNENTPTGTHKNLWISGMEIGGNYNTITNEMIMGKQEKIDSTGYSYDTGKDNISNHSLGKLKFMKNTVDNKGNLVTLEILPSFMELLDNAQENIVIVTPYLSSPEIIHVIIKKIHEGKDVTLLLPILSDYQDALNKKNLVKILEKTVDKHNNMPANLHVHLYKEGIHKKITIIDGDKIILGSANMDDLSMKRNGELCVFLEKDHKNKKTVINNLIEDVKENVYKDFENSLHIKNIKDIAYSQSHAFVEQNLIDLIK